MYTEGLRNRGADYHVHHFPKSFIYINLSSHTRRQLENFEYKPTVCSIGLNA